MNLEGIPDVDAMLNISEVDRNQAACLDFDFVISSDTDYEKIVLILNKLLDAGAANEHSAMSDVVDALGRLIGDYEDSLGSSPVAQGVVLRFLMEQHRLVQSDLPEIGTSEVVLEILQGTRTLDAQQMEWLAAQFQVPMGVFIQDKQSSITSITSI